MNNSEKKTINEDSIWCSLKLRIPTHNIDVDMAVRPLSIRILGSAGVLPNIMILLYPLDKQGVIDNFLEVVLGKNIMP